MGFFAIPSVGDAIRVTFKNGNHRWPLWEYGEFKQGQVPEAVKVNGDRPDNVVLQTLAGQRIEMDGFNKQIRITDAYSNVIQMGEQGIRLGKLDSKTQKAVLGESAVSVQKEMYSAVLAAFDTIKQAAELSNKTLVVQGAPSPFSLILASMFGLKLPDTPVTPEGEEPPLKLFCRRVFLCQDSHKRILMIS